MSEVQTVRGAVDSADLGRTYMHEHIFVLTADVQQNYPDEWGTRTTGWPDAVTSSPHWRRSGVRTDRRPDRDRPRPPHPAYPTRGGAGPRPEHRRGDGLLHLPRRPVLLPPPRPGPGRGKPTRWRSCSSATSPKASPARASEPACSSAPSTTGHDRRSGEGHACGRRRRTTGTAIPIMVHTHPASQDRPRRANKCMCEEEGVDPSRVVLSHSGDTTDADHLSNWPRPASSWAWTVSV